MTLKYIKEYRNSEISDKIVDKIKRINQKQVRLMEVCGTHTMSIFKNGIRSILPETISLVSGPGCPVCVTAQHEIDAFIELARVDDVIITTFGDLLRVPGTESSLTIEQAKGRDIRVVYSTLDALTIAKKNPKKLVVFLGVGFETTTPTIAASILSAQQMQLDNYYVFCANKLIPPALLALIETEEVNIDGFMLPGHVSVIIGSNAYLPLIKKKRIPCVIAGFEPVDILQAVFMLVSQIESGAARLENSYPRVVTNSGNKKAQEIINAVFEPADAHWRGIGRISKSGLKIREAFASYDARKMFAFNVPEAKEPKGCECGKILLGLMTPPECALYKKACSPLSPIGPCMVSSEGTCAAYYRYFQNQ